MQLIDILKFKNSSQLLVSSPSKDEINLSHKTCICNYIDNGIEKELAYIPNSTLLGSLRHGLAKYKQCLDKIERSQVEALENELFGVIARYKGENPKTGRIRVSNAYSDPLKQSYEILQRHRISYKAGNLHSNIPSFEALVCSEGHEFYAFVMVKLIGLRDDQLENTKKMLSIMYDSIDKGIIQIGGQKSAGLGYVKIDRISRIYLDNKDIFKMDSIDEYIKNDKYLNESLLPLSLKNFFPNILWGLSCPKLVGELAHKAFIKVAE